MGKTTQPARQDNIDAIVAYFKSGIKDEATHIGIELEHTLVKENGDAVSYDETYGQRWVLEQLEPAFQDRIETSRGDLIGLIGKNSTVTLEPAAQVELSAGPFSTLQEASACFGRFEEVLEDAVRDKGIEVLTPGYHPTCRAVDLHLLPKRRYEFMNKYLGAISMFGICMMRGSASTQVAIDYTSLDDCLRKLRLANACVPLFSLMCDNAPVFEAQPRKHYMVRTEIWEKCDPARCMLVPGVMERDFSLEDYAEYILDTPAIVKIEDGVESYSEETFGDIFATTPMQRADVEHAVSMFFTDIRLKTYVEIRPADAMPLDYVIAYAALIKGLFYNKASLEALDSLLDGVSAQDIVAAKASLMENGYQGSVYGHPVSELTDELISIAANGLSDADRAYLVPLAVLVASRTTLADIALRKREQS